MVHRYRSVLIMALSPEKEFDDFEDDSEVIETSRTYRIDFENGRTTNELR